MANATIYSYTPDVFSWTSGVSDKTHSESETTLVTNSSGVTVYWTQAGSSGSIANTGTLNCEQGPVNKKWNFSESSGAGANVRITLTVSGGGT
jgi:hypothetical protein